MFVCWLAGWPAVWLVGWLVVHLWVISLLNPRNFSRVWLGSACTKESSHKEWHLQGCFVLRVVAADQKISAVLLEGAPGIC